MNPTNTYSTVVSDSLFILNSTFFGYKLGELARKENVASKKGIQEFFREIFQLSTDSCKLGSSRFRGMEIDQSSGLLSWSRFCYVFVG